MIFLAHADNERRIYYGPRALAALRALGDVRLNETGSPLDGAAFAAAAAGCTIIVADNKATAPAELFDAAPDLLAYVHGHVDTRRIDVAAASRNGILVTRSIPTFGPAVSELVIGFMIDLSRGITRSTSAWRNGGAPQIHLSNQLGGQVLGIIGYGHIGRRLALIARAFDMRVAVHDPYVTIDPAEGVEPMGFDALLGASDFVVPLAVATPETRHLIGGRALSLMKPTAYLVNVSRGDLIDEDALEAALDARAIAGAALDVGSAPFQMPPDRLARRGDVLATPHIAGVTPQANEGQAMETVRQVAEILKGGIPSGALNGEHAARLRASRIPG